MSSPWSEIASAVLASGTTITLAWLRTRVRRSRDQDRSPERAALDESWDAYRELRVHLDARFAEVTAENKSLKEEIEQLRKEVARLGRLEAENEELRLEVKDLQTLLDEAHVELKRALLRE